MEPEQDPYAVDARYYDLIHDEFDEDIGFWLALAGETPLPVLECGAGSGRIAVALAAAGHTVTGIEPSKAMLALAQERAARCGVAISFVQGTARDVSLEPEAYGLALAGLDTFLYCVDQAEQLDTLRNLGGALHFNGLLALDLPGPASWLDPASSGSPLLAWSGASPAGHLHAWHVRDDDLALQTRTLEILYETTRADGAIHREITTHNLRYVGRYEAELLLEAAGLRVAGVYGGYGFEPLTGESARMIVTARRADG